MTTKVKSCNHMFVAVNGGSWSGSVSYHGSCRLCGIEMSAYGKVDDNNNGELFIRTVDGKHSIKKTIKEGNVL